jgi:deazaflavin-dependent oxidoreductase (nitroreductase family)
MLRRTTIVIGALVAAGSAWFLFILVAMRTRSPRLLTTVRRFNRAGMNKLQLRTAGRPGVSASVIRHRGRRSGRTYETPVVPFASDDGFLISLPYGPNTDWLKNVLASGSAELVTDGRTHTVDRPEVVSTAMAKERFPPKEQRNHRWFGVDQCLRLRSVGSADAHR